MNRPAGHSKDLNTFVTILDLALDDETNISDLATAIQTTKYYIWDRFLRYRHVTPDTTDNELVQHRESLLEELASGIRGMEYDRDYYESLVDTPSRLNFSGWGVNDLPNFEEVSAAWRKNNSSGQPIPIFPQKQLPRSNAGIYKIVYSALVFAVDGNVEFLDEIVSDNTRSGNTGILRKKLLLDHMMDRDTFKPFIDRALKYGKFEFPEEHLSEMKQVGKHRNITKIA